MTIYLSIDELIEIRNRLTDRPGVDEQIDYTAIDQIDAQLAQVAPGVDNRIDQLLGRLCAEPTPRVEYQTQNSTQAEIDRQQRIYDQLTAVKTAWLSESEVKPGYIVNPAVTLLQPETIALIEQTRLIFEAATEIAY